MKDKKLPYSIGEEASEPVYFPRKDEICNRLDEFYESSGVQRGVQPSSMFLGALYAMRKENKENNPDWMSQVAHSFREIFFKLGLGGFASAFKNYGSAYDAEFGAQKVGKYYNFITEIAHHNYGEAGRSSLVGGSENAPVEITPEVFEEIALQFGDIIFTILRRQIDAHREIDKILCMNPKNISNDQLKELINLNLDARQYFYAKADKRWLEWLWTNGFLDILEQKAENPTWYGYRTPEINYLVRIAKNSPAKVVNIILKVKVSEDTFNPEVLAQFLHICSNLPARQTAKVVDKIRDERWVPLMGIFNRWGFEYEMMFKTLAEAKDYKSLLRLVEAVLTIRSKEEIEKLLHRGFTDNPFYFEDLSYTKVFDYLANVSNEYAEEALALAGRKITEIIDLCGRDGDEVEVFKATDWSPLLDVDFFTLELGQDKSFSSRDDMRELAAVMKVLVQRVIGDKCKNPKEVRITYEKHIQPLPDTRTMWRLRMFVLSLCPRVFREELKDAFFRLFEVEDCYNEIIAGTEYKKALQKGFTVLSDEMKEEYIRQIIEYFGQERENNKEKAKYLRDGSKLLSMILPYVKKNPALEKQFKNAGFAPSVDYKPIPAFSALKSGFVVPRGPMTDEKFNQVPVIDITKKLKEEWSPEELSRKNTAEDFLTPLNAEGVEQLLKNDIKKRIQEYVDNASLFFERDVLHTHYTYAYLRGIQEAIKKNKEQALNVNWYDLIKLLKAIKSSGEKEIFTNGVGDHKLFDALLTGWNSVHSAMADVIQELLSEQDNFTVIDFPTYREQLFCIIAYLLHYPDPIPEDEQIDTAKMKSRASGAIEFKVSNPFNIAINSVRGRAFETFVLFVCQDDEKYEEKEKSKLSEDVKRLIESVLNKESTRAVMFMFGRYLPTFYFLDKDWLRKLLPQMFPRKLMLYTAAWEGYLTNNLYEKIFLDSEIQKLYKCGITLKNDKSLEQEHFKRLDEGIAVHLALAYTHYEKFSFEHPLLNQFWKDGTQNHHSYFISFIGRALISSDNNRIGEIEEKGIEVKERIGQLWDWMLESYNDLQPFKEFGFWINLEKGIFEVDWLAERLKRTLEKTKGILTQDYALTETIKQLAMEVPKDTLEIAHWYLLEGGVRNRERRRPLLLGDEWFDALKILYTNEDTKTRTNTLINKLVRKGGSDFWSLKKIVEDSS